MGRYSVMVTRLRRNVERGGRGLFRGAVPVFLKQPNCQFIPIARKCGQLHNILFLGLLVQFEPAISTSYLRVSGSKPEQSLTIWTVFLYSSPNIVRVIKSRRMRWVGHVARMGRWEMLTNFWSEDPHVDGRILGWILKRIWWCGLDPSAKG